MALIVENGSVVAGADSWATLTEARALAAKYGVTLPADDAEAELAMRNGGAYVNGYEPNMAGVRVSDVQTMCYPRAFISCLCGSEFIVYSLNHTVIFISCLCGSES